MSHRFFSPALLEQRDSQVQMRPRMVGLEAQHRFELSLSFSDAAADGASGNGTMDRRLWATAILDARQPGGHAILPLSVNEWKRNNHEAYNLIYEPKNIPRNQCRPDGNGC